MMRKKVQFLRLYFIGVPFEGCVVMSLGGSLTRYCIANNRARLVRSPGGPGMGGSLRLKERSMSMPTRHRIAMSRARLVRSRGIGGSLRLKECSMSMPTRYCIAMSRARIVKSPGGPGMGGSIRLKERSMSMPTRYRISIDRACFEECSVPMPTSTVQTHCTIFVF
jgi:hypothetical protein